MRVRERLEDGDAPLASRVHQLRLLSRTSRVTSPPSPPPRSRVASGRHRRESGAQQRLGQLADQRRERQLRQLEPGGGEHVADGLERVLRGRAARANLAAISPSRGISCEPRPRGSSATLEDSRRTSANLGEPRRTSGHLGEPRDISGNVGASRRTLGNLGASLDGSAPARAARPPHISPASPQISTCTCRASASAMHCVGVRSGSSARAAGLTAHMRGSVSSAK